MKKKILSVVLAGAMIISMGATAFAADPGAKDEPDRQPVDFDGQGYIAAEDEGDGPGPGDMIDLTIPANGFFWYANEDTANAGGTYDIKSAKYQIINNSETVNLEVTLKSYDQSGALDEIENSPATELNQADVVVGLAGDLYFGDDTVVDLVNNPGSSTINYKYEDKLLGASGTATDTWEYSFYGTYNQSSLPSAPHTSDYTMVLQFEAVSSIGQ